MPPLWAAFPAHPITTGYIVLLVTHRDSAVTKYTFLTNRGGAQINPNTCVM